MSLLVGGAGIKNENLSRVLNSVMKVKVNRQEQNIQQNISGEHSSGVGTAFIIPSNPNGNKLSQLALTCYHVVANATNVEVQLAKHNSPIPALIVAVNPDNDIALISFNMPEKINGGDDTSKMLELGNSNTLSVGEELYTAGFPLGSDIKFSQGIVSGWDANIQTGRISTTAAINPGNSGGPLIRASDGKVIGIVDSKIGGGDVANIAFGVPIEYFKQLHTKMRMNENKVGVIRNPVFGLCYSPLSPEMIKLSNKKINGGIMVTNVLKHSEAEKMGLKKGDVITSITYAGKTYDLHKEHGQVNVSWSTQPVQFSELLHRAPIDELSEFHVVKFEMPPPRVISAGSNVKVDPETKIVKMKKSTNPYTGALKFVHFPFESMESVNVLGMTLSPLRANFLGTSPAILALYMKYNDLERQNDMVIVTYVHRNSPASKFGIIPGAHLLSFNSHAINTISDVISASKMPLGGSVLQCKFWVMGKERELLSDVSSAYNLEKQYEAQNVYGTKSTTAEILDSWKPVSEIEERTTYSATNSVSDIESQMTSNVQDSKQSISESVSEVEFDESDWHGELATLVDNLKRETKFLHEQVTQEGGNSLSALSDNTSKFTPDAVRAKNSRKFNCGCGQDPCITYGRNKNVHKMPNGTIMPGKNHGMDYADEFGYSTTTWGDSAW